MKRGVVWSPDGNNWWARSHATCPTPVWLEDGTLRIYIQCRDDKNIGRVGYVDVDPDNPLNVLRIAESPVLDVGEPGCFDDNGILQTSIIHCNKGCLWMYYVGFELGQRIRYRLLTGLAISDDGGNTFQRLQRNPILERSDKEPYFRGGPYVLKEGEHYRMWYVGGGSWVKVNGKLMPVYDIRHIKSNDGINWPSQGEVVLPLTDSNEHGFGRPYVVKTNGAYQMYYSIRKIKPNTYRLGYAESANGIVWARKDKELRLDVSSRGWDSESIEYSAVVECGGKVWMFYNGNDFGATGFGLAELAEE